MDIEEIKKNAPDGATHYHIVSELDILYVLADDKGCIYTWNTYFGGWDYTSNGQYQFLCKTIKPL